MSKRPFNANSWLQDVNTENPFSEGHTMTKGAKSYKDNGEICSRECELSDAQPEDNFTLGHFLIPGWKGESLINKPANIIKKAQEDLWRDALFQFKNLDNLNTSLKLSIFNEYLAYAKNAGHSPTELEVQSNFWPHFKNETSPYRKHLKNFLEIYSFRVATVYLYKLMFISNLSEHLPLPLKANDLMFPHSLLQKLFRKGSSTELKCESLRQNQYSWYRPNTALESKIKILGENFKHLGISQLMKLSTYRGLKNSVRHLDFSDEDYSHALSHRAFGLFLNTLLIYFPIWSRKETLDYPQSDKLKYPDVINTKFTGDKLHSLSHGHWLAQEFNLQIPWSEIICPVFSPKEVKTAPFQRINHELQFLTFMVKFAHSQGHPIKETLCSIMESKYKSSEEESGSQISLFNKATDYKKDLIYERVVLNISDLPKQNPHHYLIQQIYAQKMSLAVNGHLYVLSDQKLFVPSQSQRVEQLLKEFKIEAIFDFERLQGKGEISHYVYILKKRDIISSPKPLIDLDPLTLTTGNGPKQEACLNFRWTGELSLFGKFESLVKELESFFKSRGPNSTSFWQKSIGQGLSFEFHQDAIIEGKLLSSISKDSNNITHPHFFKKLTELSSPLNHFFSIDNILKANKKHFASSYLGIYLQRENLYSHVLIVDHRDPSLVRLEIAPFESYQAKREEYGVAYFQYFGLTQKIPHLNINLFREFFTSGLGQQVIQLSLNGGPKKVKSKLETLLIPNFFKSPDQLPKELHKKIEIFSLNSEEILNLHPDSIIEKVKNGMSVISENLNQFPWVCMGLASQLKFSMNKALEKVSEDNDKNGEHYSHPLILKSLLQLESRPIYPNEDIYIDFFIQDRDDLKLPLESLELKESDGNHWLTVFSNGQAMIKFFSKPVLLQFLKFILESAKGQPFNLILQNLRLPPISELKQVLNNFQEIEKALELGQESSSELIQRFFVNYLTKR